MSSPSAPTGRCVVTCNPNTASASPQTDALIDDLLKIHDQLHTTSTGDVTGKDN